MTQELLGRVHRELLDVLNSINQDKIHHDGDDFHELLNDVEKALAQPEQCNYPDCKCPTENPCLKGLAQPEQEPVAWADLNALSEQINSVNCGTVYRLPSKEENRQPLYTHPPQRTWVGLTDEEIDYFIVHRLTIATKNNLAALIRICEAKLKEKNT